MYIIYYGAKKYPHYWGVKDKKQGRCVGFTLPSFETKEMGGSVSPHAAPI